MACTDAVDGMHVQRELGHLRAAAARGDTGSGCAATGQRGSSSAAAAALPRGMTPSGRVLRTASMCYPQLTISCALPGYPPAGYDLGTGVIYEEV